MGGPKPRKNDNRGTKTVIKPIVNYRIDLRYI